MLLIVLLTYDTLLFLIDFNEFLGASQEENIFDETFVGWNF